MRRRTARRFTSLVEFGEINVQPRRILVIDDDVDILNLTQLSLEMATGWEVLTASSPEDGIEQAAVHRPDAILLDLTFPNADGAEVFRQLQAGEATSGIPVLLVSGMVQPSTRARFAELGAAGLIEKPYDATKLADQVAAILAWQ